MQELIDQITNSCGRKFWFYQNDTFFRQRLAGGPFQGKNLKFLRDFCPDARTIIDVGMNIGTNTIEYGTWAKDVHSFEPTPQTYDIARANIDIAKAQPQSDFKKGWYKVGESWADMTITANIHTYQVGVGNTHTTSEIVVQKNNSGHNFVTPSRINSRAPKVEPEKYTITIETLDSYNFQDVDIIKMDVEGFEYNVLQGAEDTIAKWKPIVQAEMIPAQFKRYGHTVDEIVKFFVDRDYKMLLRDGTVLPDKFELVKGTVDRFFVHKDHPRLNIASGVIDTFFEK
jgi:FkbM family methyltransferase